MEMPLADLEGSDFSSNEHLVHCDTDLALCGKDMTDGPREFGSINEQTCCEICINKCRLGGPCGVPGCEGWEWSG